MPIYEYECVDCTKRFERLVPISASTPSRCDCGSLSVRRLVSRPGVVRRLDVGLGRAAYPTSWEETGGGDRETVLHWQKRVEQERKQEAKSPELVALRAATADKRWQQAHPGAHVGAGVGSTHHHGHSHPARHTDQIERPSGGQHRLSGSGEPHGRERTQA